MNRSVLISCRIKSIGKSTDKKSGVTGSRVPGCSTGLGGTGLSALTLYQYFGRSLSFNRNRVWSVMVSLLWKYRIYRGAVCSSAFLQGSIVGFHLTMDD